MDEAKLKVAIHELEEIWEHYRHLENQRNSYLVAFLTVTSAAIGFVVTLAAIRNGTSGTRVVFVAACPISAAAITFGVFAYAAIIRFSFLLREYQKMLVEVRDWMHKEVDFQPKYHSEYIELDVRKRIPEAILKLNSGPQTTAENVMALVISVLVLVPVIGAFSVIWVDKYSTLELVVLFVSVTFELAVLALLALPVFLTVAWIERDKSSN
jgi:ABC-type multidrug transport system fused ATPase/permease subunit